MESYTRKYNFWTSEGFQAIQLQKKAVKEGDIFCRLDVFFLLLGHLVLGNLALASWHWGILALGNLALGNLAFGEERSPWALGHLALGVLAPGSLWAHNLLFPLVQGHHHAIVVTRMNISQRRRAAVSTCAYQHNESNCTQRTNDHSRKGLSHSMTNKGSVSIDRYGTTKDEY
jgi:hypothetical protein